MTTTSPTVNPQASAYRAYLAAHPGSITPEELREQIAEMRPQLQILMNRASYPDGMATVHRHLHEALSHLLAARDASHLLAIPATLTEH